MPRVQIYRTIIASTVLFTILGTPGLAFNADLSTVLKVQPNFTYDVIETVGEIAVRKSIYMADIDFIIHQTGPDRILCRFQAQAPKDKLATTEMVPTIDAMDPLPTLVGDRNAIDYKVDPMPFYQTAATLCEKTFYIPLAILLGRPAPQLPNKNLYAAAMMNAAEVGILARTSLLIETDPVKYLDAQAASLSAVQTVDYGGAVYKGTSLRSDVIQGLGEMTYANGKKTSGTFNHGFCVQNCIDTP